MGERTNWRIWIAALACLAYGPALHTPFLFDDHILIRANPVVRTLSLSAIGRDLTSEIFNNPSGNAHFYRPLQVFSTQVEYALWRLNPVPYHLTNLILHIGCALLLFELGLAIGFGVLAAGLAGCLLSVHPVIVEDLLMVSGRNELMGLFFVLASLLCALRPGRGPLGLSMLFYVLALLSKESAAVMPVLLAAILYYQKASAARYRALIPFVLLTLCYLPLRHYALGQFAPDVRPALYAKFLFIAFPRVLLRYLRILIVPYDLHTDRLLSSIGPLWWVSTAAVILFAIWLFVRGPRAGRFAFLWYVVSILPKVPLMVGSSFMSDHWAYPAIPALAWPAGLWWERLRNPGRPTAVRRATLAAAVLALGALSATTLWNIQTRNTDEKLYSSALKYTSSPTMQYNLASELLRQGRFAESIGLLSPLFAAHPDDANLCRALALAYWRNNDKQRAIEILKTFLRTSPDDKLTESLLRQIQASR